MLVFAFQDHLLMVVLLESGLMLHGKPEESSRDDVPGPPLMWMDVGAVDGEFLASCGGLVLILCWETGSCVKGHTEIPEEDAGVVVCRDIGKESTWEVDMATVGLDAGGGLAEAVGGFVRD